MDERMDDACSKRWPAADGAGEPPDEPSEKGSARLPTAPRSGRLLPWSGPEGKPCYLFTDDSDGFLSRMADDMETMQLRMAEEIVEFAGEAADGTLGEAELRFLVARMAEALRDACRIAHSRSRRDCGARPSPA